jgi:divalent metal cation (Fe/Co/Zn/Cd) transporter
MDRTIKLAIFSLLFNAFFAVYHIISGATAHSWWLFTLGIYYAILSIVRFAVLKTKKQNDFVTRFTGVVLMLLSLPLAGIVILAVVRDRGIVMHEIVMIAMATYSFTKITLATVNLIKSRKSNSAKLVTLRNISLSDAFVSIFALQRSMLVSFGNMSETNICIFNAVVGTAVCVMVFLLGLNLARRKKIMFGNLSRDQSS